MKVIDYLKAKYGKDNPTTILYAEAKIFGVKYPLKAGWIWKYGNLEITPDIAKRLRFSLEKIIKENHPRSDSAKIGLKVLDDAYLELKRIPSTTSVDFLKSKSWQRARIQAFNKYGNRCQCCGASPSDGARLCVDHIKPRIMFPELALDLDNLQILCAECNSGKGNWDMSDWREEQKQ